MKKYVWIGILLSMLLCLGSMAAGCTVDGQSAGQQETTAGENTGEPMGGDASGAASREPLTIWVATDLHYLSEELYGETPIFLTTLKQGDGKLTEKMPQILDIFVEQVLTARPEALVLAGDLTFNGERLSLQHLADKLSVVQQAGIPVLVIPGNHDIDSFWSMTYVGDGMSSTEPITKDGFYEICGAFGYEQAVARDENSFSYLYSLAEDVQLLCLDGNPNDYQGALTEETLAWAEAQLAEAQKQGKTVLTVTHQNVLPQNSLLYYGYAFYNYEDVAAMLQKYGVTANFSGHSHLQHVAQEGDLKDYATGSLAVTPLRYGVITVDAQREIHYEMVSLAEPRPTDGLPVSEDAKELVRLADQRFEDCNRRQLTEMLDAIQQRSGFDDAQQETMTAFMVAVNRSYIAGEMTDPQAYLSSEGWSLWSVYCADTFWWQ